MVGPEPRHGGLLRAPHAAVDTPQVLHLVEVSRVFPAAQGRGSVRSELRRVVQGQRQHVRHPCSKRRRRCGRLIDSRAGWSLDVGHHAIEPVVGSEQEHPDPDFFTDHDAIGLRLRVRYPIQIGEVEIIQSGLLIGETSHEHAVRGGGDRGLHRRVRRYGWCDRIRPIAALDGDDHVVDRRVDDAHVERPPRRETSCPRRRWRSGRSGSSLQPRVPHWTVRRPESGSNRARQPAGSAGPVADVVAPNAAATPSPTTSTAASLPDARIIVTSIGFR